MLPKQKAIEILHRAGLLDNLHGNLDIIEEKIVFLESTFDVKICRNSLSYNKGTSDVMINNLVGRSKTFKALSMEKQKNVSNAVSMLMNLKKTGEMMIERANEFYPMLVKADKDRKKNITELEFNGRNFASTKLGEYVIHVTGDPLLIALKTSGRPWSAIASSKLFIDYNFPAEPLDDIVKGNYIAFLIEDDGNPYAYDDAKARIMLRRCITETGKVDIGMEKFWYFGNRSKSGHAEMDSSQVIATSEGYEISASTATKELVKFLKSFGYLDYKMCMTPYKYQGYSDTAGGHDTIIKYKKQRA